MSEAVQTSEGWYALHDIRRFKWAEWKALPDGEREEIAAGAVSFFRDCEAVADAPQGNSALYSLLGHKGDLMILHLRPTLDQLLSLQLAFSQTRLADFTERAYSYVSVTELSSYGASSSKGKESGEPDPKREAFIARRLRPEIPGFPYVSFYPMSKKRGESENWYTLPLEERRRLIAGHGMIGRSYHGRVQQMITGSMGYDDWEWGVTLYATDPLPIKKIVQEMRFDDASSKYGLFGPFFLGIRLPVAELSRYTAGEWTGPQEAGKE